MIKKNKKIISIFLLIAISFPEAAVFMFRSVNIGIGSPPKIKDSSVGPSFTTCYPSWMLSYAGLLVGDMSNFDVSITISHTDPNWYAANTNVDQLHWERFWLAGNPHFSFRVETIIGFKSDLSKDDINDVHVNLQVLFGSASARYNCIYIWNENEGYEPFCSYLPWDTPYMIQGPLSGHPNLDDNIKNYIDQDGEVTFKLVVESDAYISGYSPRYVGWWPFVWIVWDPIWSPAAVRTRIDMAYILFEI